MGDIALSEMVAVCQVQRKTERLQFGLKPAQTDGRGHGVHRDDGLVTKIQTYVNTHKRGHETKIQ